MLNSWWKSGGQVGVLKSKIKWQPLFLTAISPETPPVSQEGEWIHERKILNHFWGLCLCNPLTWIPAIHFLPPSPTFQCCYIEVLACELFGHMLKPECLPVSSDLSFFNDKTHLYRVWLWHSLMAADRHPRIFHLRKHDSFSTLGHSILIHLFTLSCYLPCNIFCKSAYAFVDLGNIKLIKVYSVLTLYIKILLS